MDKDAVIMKIKDALRKNDRNACVCYDFDSAHSVGERNDVDNLEFMTLARFLQFAKDAKLVEKGALSKENVNPIARNIFSRGIAPKEQGKAERQCLKRCKAFNFGRRSAFHRFSFLEFLIRVADFKFHKDPASATKLPLETALLKLSRHHLTPLITKELHKMDSDAYREARLYKHRIHDRLSGHQHCLEELFNEINLLGLPREEAKARE